MENKDTANRQQGRRSILLEPKAQSQELSDDRIYEAKRSKDLVLIDRLNSALRDDQITKFLGASWYVADKTWVFLKGATGVTYPVTRFYPQLNVAMDIMVSVEGRSAEIEFKRKVFKKQKIKYGVLDYTMQLSDLIPQIGLPPQT